VLCVWGGSHVALKIMRWALEIFLWSVTSGDFVLSSCHYLISVNISSISSLVVLNGEEEDVTVHVIIFSMYTLKFVYEKLQHTTYTHLFWIALAFVFRKDHVYSQISVSYQICRQCKHVKCITTSRNDIMYICS
jgi:hypothetical protein